MPRAKASANSSDRSFQMTGKVVPGSIRHEGARLHFRVRDRTGTASVPVLYSGVVPDPFRDGREVIVTGRLTGATPYFTEFSTSGWRIIPGTQACSSASGIS